MTARLNRSGRNLDDELGEYLLWLEPTLAKVGLTWEEVVVAERDESTAWRDYVSGDGASFDLPRGRAVAPADFAARFRAILNEAARGWVNLTADTIKDGRLIVVVEWCSEPKRVGSEPSRPIWVNWSGLSFQEAARLAALRK